MCSFFLKFIYVQLVILSIILRHSPLSQALSFSATPACVGRPTALITGSTDGIGVTTAKNMAAKGYNVLIHGRSSRRIAQAVQNVESFCQHHSNDPGQVIPLPAADISTREGCVQLVNHVKSILQDNKTKTGGGNGILSLDVIMNNAGVYEKSMSRTSDGVELTFAVNVLAPFIITSMLLSTMLESTTAKKKGNARIVIASSISQCRSIRDWEDLAFYQHHEYSAHGAYSESKLCDAMLSMEMAARLQAAGLGTDRITCNCLDPGTVNTKMLLAGWGPCGIDVDDALDQTWLCTSAEVESVTGEYFIWQSSRRASADAYDPKERDALWNLCSRLAPEAALQWDEALSAAGTK
jgi:NAD(P)-dependent dehydrogenase (short-subunit alcohol dehydrogenase family)